LYVSWVERRHCLERGSERVRDDSSGFIKSRENERAVVATSRREWNRITVGYKNEERSGEKKIRDAIEKSSKYKKGRRNESGRREK
jgi:hypothetical protein